jgi:hypothetical protein
LLLTPSNAWEPLRLSSVALSVLVNGLRLAWAISVVAPSVVPGGGTWAWIVTPGMRAHQRGVALERLAGQRPFGLDFRGQLVDASPLTRPTSPCICMSRDVAFHQHHARHAVIQTAAAAGTRTTAGNRPPGSAG